MTVSYPSRKLTVADVPEVVDFRARFVYNFFVPDEMTEAFGGVPQSELRRPAESFDAQRIDRVSKVIPRFVRFDFSPPMTQEDESFIHNEFVKDKDHAGNGPKYSVKAMAAKGLIQTEQDFSNSSFTGVAFQDDNADAKLFAIVSGSIAKRAASRNRLIHQQIDDDKQKVIDSIADQHSLMDAARALSDQTSTSVSDNFVVNTLNSIDALGLTFIDDERQKEMVDASFERIKGVMVKGQVNNKLLSHVIKNAVDDPLGIYRDELAPIQGKASNIQRQALNSHNANVIDRNDYTLNFRALSMKHVDVHDAMSKTKVVGFIIDKHEIFTDGTVKQHPSIVIQNPRATTGIDTQVAYGRTYVYSIRVIAELEARTVADASMGIIQSTGLLSSRRSSRSTVVCTENVPPPPPSDFNVVWDYKVDAPMLLWTFPTNTQRDIKKFQVFRRSSVDEAFQLLQEIDFDDSDVMSINLETPDPSLVKKLPGPTTSFTDVECTRESNFIYAVCSIDAHALTSGYSMQLGISFDHASNRIMKRLISSSGAPKSYPNMQLDQDLFVDTLKDSGHSRLKLYFDPEFLKITDRDGNDLRLIATDRSSSKYRLQLINTDVVKQEVIDITITDLSTHKV